ncbi:tRNA (adenosine(37)-N6)-threonylcarbamoyltransferase complex dimerization subunit type 1 TsaB [Aquibacillus sediminis]|uniref:tRNA (adenosine(37)-N6)-threonylcarbamoyltransferase complex dimerization subunit type 1 TsaB n=1 Tax=Aquibacillus sediminis TaxID=2574734 RepID=UPI00110851F9|nr:tRNA (adenosine(37)-N6)-threonylcarbamoyltransferase complex dimerization subunit type 1 TsaB [Aquibacillus sediminis]
MNILAIDTSNQVMGVAVQKDGQLAGEYITNVKRNHSVRLMPAIDQVMKDTATSPKDLDKIVVAKGPGSYTGVRIGLSTAKTIAWTLNIPIVSLSSLEMLAYNGMWTNELICPFFDARRGLVYTGLYQRAANGQLEQVWNDTNILLADWLQQVATLQKKVVFLSQDIHLHHETITTYMGDLAIIPDGPIHLPKASYLAQAGMYKEASSVHTLTPNYLRLAEAEAKWLAEQQGK